jgi:plasmid stability protein
MKNEELRPLMTRIPESLRARLEKSAARSHRSMNAELIYRLEESYRREEREQIIGLAAQQATTAATTAMIETLGPKLDAINSWITGRPK